MDRPLASTNDGVLVNSPQYHHHHHHPLINCPVSGGGGGGGVVMARSLLPWLLLSLLLIVGSAVLLPSLLGRNGEAERDILQQTDTNKLIVEHAYHLEKPEALVSRDQTRNFGKVNFGSREAYEMQQSRLLLTAQVDYNPAANPDPQPSAPVPI